MVVYIHELEAWPAFRWDAETLTPQLAAVSRQQGRLIGRMQDLGFSLQDEAVVETISEDVLGSSAIEGEHLDKQEVRSSVARRLGVHIAHAVAAGRDVEGVVEMMLDATQNYAKPLTAERLFRWHTSLFPSGHSGLSPIIAGRWRTDRTGPMQVVSGAVGHERVHFDAPPANRLEQEMGRFLEWFDAKDGQDPVVRSAIAHLWFVTIHPFEDGNGRIARAIADMALARSEDSPRRFYSMSAQIRTERKDYYDVLERTQRGDLDITPWLQWFLGCLGRAIAASDGMLSSVLREARFFERHAGEAFNERQRLMLGRILNGFEGKLTSSKWAAIAKCSQDTASRDIDDLIRRGILIRDAAGGRSTSYSLVVP
ncbi:MAG TPA: Fic family protein [Caulobacteraceae bacterium]|nr:Fic family protein [Caulobacteraceae bacterium]